MAKTSFNRVNKLKDNHFINCEASVCDTQLNKIKYVAISKPLSFLKNI